MELIDKQSVINFFKLIYAENGFDPHEIHFSLNDVINNLDNIRGTGFIGAAEIEAFRNRIESEPTMTVKVLASTISRYTELCLIYGCERVEEIFNTKINDAIRTAIAETLKELKGADNG